MQKNWVTTVNDKNPRRCLGPTNSLHAANADAAGSVIIR